MDKKIPKLIGVLYPFGDACAVKNCPYDRDNIHHFCVRHQSWLNVNDPYREYDNEWERIIASEIIEAHKQLTAKK